MTGEPSGPAEGPRSEDDRPRLERGDELPVEARPAHTGSLAPTAGPPGGRIFSVEARPAPGLYLVAWTLSVGGIAAFVVAALAGGAGGITLAVGGLVALAVGVAAAAGYQVLARADRHPQAYRGPSPVLLFALVFLVSNLTGLALLAAGVGDPTAPLGFLLGVTAIVVTYVGAVWLFVVRTGVLRWREIALPMGGRYGGMRLLADILYAGGVMIPATFAALLLGGIVAQLVRASPPDVVPTATSVPEVVAVGLAAAILAPIGEEIFFRGFSVTAWGRDIGASRALVRSALFFALVHNANIASSSFAEGVGQAVVQFAVILPLGFVLGWLYLQRGLVAAATGHMTYNGTVLLLSVVVARLMEASPA